MELKIDRGTLLAVMECMADKEHRRKYNQETLQALVSNGFDEKLATEFIKLVASNKIPHMTMNY
ncbi:hypothetical protein I4565_16920 [Proteus mirabilis]|nr:hypothetical protein [Proteus mirabilis]